MKDYHDLLAALDIAATPESRNLSAPQTSLETGKDSSSGRSKMSTKEPLGRAIGKKPEQTGKDDRRKCVRGKAPSREQSRSKRSRQEEIDQILSPDAGTGAQPDEGLQELATGLKNLKSRQVKKRRRTVSLKPTVNSRKKK